MKKKFEMVNYNETNQYNNNIIWKTNSKPSWQNNTSTEYNNYIPL